MYFHCPIALSTPEQQKREQRPKKGKKLTDPTTRKLEFRLTETLVNNAKSETVNWEEMFAVYITDKEVRYLIHRHFMHK